MGYATAKPPPAAHWGPVRAPRPGGRDCGRTWALGNLGSLQSPSFSAVGVVPDCHRQHAFSSWSAPHESRHRLISLRCFSHLLSVGKAMQQPELCVDLPTSVLFGVPTVPAEHTMPDPRVILPGGTTPDPSAVSPATPGPSDASPAATEGVCDHTHVHARLVHPPATT